MPGFFFGTWFRGLSSLASGSIRIERLGFSLLKKGKLGDRGIGYGMGWGRETRGGVGE